MTVHTDRFCGWLSLLLPCIFRFLFDISSFTSDNSLSLVGASWFVAKPDEYTRQLYTSSGGNLTSLCAGQPNFDTPCPVSGSTHWGPTLYQMLLTLSCFLSIKMIVTSSWNFQILTSYMYFFSCLYAMDQKIIITNPKSFL